MGRHTKSYNDQDIAQLKIESYCSACGISFFKEGLKRGRLTQIFDRHCQSKKHKLNTQRYYVDLVYDTKSIIEIVDLDDETSRIEPFIDNLNDDHLTSISSVIDKNKLDEANSKIKALSDTNSIVLSNMKQIESRTLSLSENNIELLKKLQQINQSKYQEQINQLKY
jgi:hypothetical protein